MRFSLAGRLACIYAALAPVLLAAAMTAQYRSLVRSLASEDDRLLAGTLEAAQQTGTSSTAWQRPEQPDNPIVRLVDAQCRRTTSSRAGEPPLSCPPPSGDSTAFRSWQSADGREWRIASLPLVRPEAGWIEAVMDRSSDQAVLAAYRVRLILALFLTAFASAALGYAVTRRGLRPLAQLAERVSRIDARSLDQRLTPPDAPVEIRRLTASFEGMLARLDRAFGALTELSTDLAHELRTPVHVLRQQTEVALQQARTVEEYREVLASTLEELEQLGRMIEDTLFLARAEDPRAHVDRLALNVHRELSEVAAFLDAIAEDSGVRLVVSAPRSLEVTANRMLMRRALVNAVSNAIRFTPSGGRVTLRGAAVAAAVVLEVCDTGEGVSADDLPRVFDRHFRGVGGLGRRPEGTGLGLSIVRGIMRLHGGQAELDSTIGVGTILRLEFPAPDGESNLTKL